MRIRNGRWSLVIRVRQQVSYQLTLRLLYLRPSVLVLWACSMRYPKTLQVKLMAMATIHVVIEFITSKTPPEVRSTHRLAILMPQLSSRTHHIPSLSSCTTQQTLQEQVAFLSTRSMCRLTVMRTMDCILSRFTTSLPIIHPQLRTQQVILSTSKLIRVT